VFGFFCGLFSFLLIGNIRSKLSLIKTIGLYLEPTSNSRNYTQLVSILVFVLCCFVFVFVFMFVFMFMFMFVFVCVFVFVFEFVCLCLCLSLYVYLSVCLCLCLCFVFVFVLCVFVFMFVCLCFVCVCVFWLFIIICFIFLFLSLFFILHSFLFPSFLLSPLKRISFRIYNAQPVIIKGLLPSKKTSPASLMVSGFQALLDALIQQRREVFHNRQYGYYFSKFLAPTQIGDERPDDFLMPFDLQPP